VKSLVDYFDRVVCINLDSCPDRWQEFCARLDNLNWPFRTPERFRAVDGEKCPPPDWMRNRYRECAGAWGCYQTHLRILEDALLDNVERLLILEDDALFVPDLDGRAHAFLRHIPANWDQLYFGGEHMLHPVLLNTHVLRCVQVHRTHAHALQRRFIQKAYDYLISYPTVDHYRRRRLWGRWRRTLRRPKSIFVSSHSEQSAHVDHHFGQMHQLDSVEVFAPRTWLAGQAAGVSSIMKTSVEESYWPMDRHPSARAA